MHTIYKALKSATASFLSDESMVGGAALAYYTVFSLPPLLVMVFVIAGMFGISEERISEIVSRQIGMPVPEQTQGDESGHYTSLGTVAERTREAQLSLKGLGPLSRGVGIAILVFSATGVFGQLQYSLNRAWGVEPDPAQGGWKNFIIKRFLSLGMIIVIAFLLLVSLVLTTIVDELIYFYFGAVPGSLEMTVGLFINNLMSLFMATILFAAMFKILPDADMRWRDMWIGAFFTAALFVIGKSAISWYLQSTQILSVWGSAASSMIALLAWVYYSSLIVLFGAELTEAWASHFGHGITPTKKAVRVVEVKRHVRA